MPQNHDAPLSEARVVGWHAALFPTGYSGMHKITVGGFRTGTESMQVVSGPVGKGLDLNNVINSLV